MFHYLLPAQGSPEVPGSLVPEFPDGVKIEIFAVTYNGEQHEYVITAPEPIEGLDALNGKTCPAWARSVLSSEQPHSVASDDDLIAQSPDRQNVEVE